MKKKPSTLAELVAEDEQVLIGLHALADFRRREHDAMGLTLSEADSKALVMMDRTRRELIEAAASWIAKGPKGLGAICDGYICKACRGSGLKSGPEPRLPDKLISEIELPPAFCLRCLGNGRDPEDGEINAEFGVVFRDGRWRLSRITGVGEGVRASGSRGLGAAVLDGEALSKAEADVIREADEWERLRSMGSEPHFQSVRLGSAVVKWRKARGEAGGEGSSGPRGPHPDSREAIGKWFVKAVDDLNGSLGVGGPNIQIELLETGAAPIFDGPCHVYNFRQEAWMKVDSHGRNGTTMMGLRDDPGAKLKFLRAIAHLPVKLEEISRLIVVVYEPEAQVGLVISTGGRR